MQTGTALPSRRVDVYFHCRMALGIAALNCGQGGSNVMSLIVHTSATDPSGPISASPSQVPFPDVGSERVGYIGRVS
jgi:hypothetical protein